jgi:hypothetical protein
MSYNHVTFMLSLPRSRSAWMAEFLGPYCVASMHNPLQQCASIDELKTKIDALPPGRVFVSDVAAVMFFDQLVAQFPGAQFLVVHRPAHEVEHSMRVLGVHPPVNIRRVERELLDIGTAIRHRAWAMTGTFFELQSLTVLTAIAKFATGVDVDSAYVHRMRNKNVQVPVAEQVARTDMLKQQLLFRKAKIIH